jgi:hypothetical protein
MRTSKIRKHVKLMALVTLIMVTFSCLPLATQAAIHVVADLKNVKYSGGQGTMTVTMPYYSCDAFYVTIGGQSVHLRSGKSQTFTGLKRYRPYVLKVSALKGTVTKAQFIKTVFTR